MSSSRQCGGKVERGTRNAFKRVRLRCRSTAGRRFESRNGRNAHGADYRGPSLKRIPKSRRTSRVGSRTIHQISIREKLSAPAEQRIIMRDPRHHSKVLGADRWTMGGAGSFRTPPGAPRPLAAAKDGPLLSAEFGERGLVCNQIDSISREKSPLMAKSWLTRTTCRILLDARPALRSEHMKRRIATKLRQALGLSLRRSYLSPRVLICSHSKFRLR